MSDFRGINRESTQRRLDETVLPEMESPEESIPKSLIPYSRDDDRSRYLGLRSSGFSVREALGLIGKTKSALSKWRLKPTFVDLETRIPEMRKTLALEYAGLEFLRNYRLVLEKDFRVLKNSLRPHPRTITDHQTGASQVIDTGMTAQDFKYLVTLRAHYTPQQLQAIEQLFGRGNSDKEFNWTDVVMTLSRTKEEVRIETRHKQPANLATIEEGVDTSLTDKSAEEELVEEGGQSVPILDSHDGEVESDGNGKEESSQQEQHQESSAQPSS